MGRGTLIPPEAPLPTAALDAATAAVLVVVEEVKAKSGGIAQSTNAHLAAFEDQLRNVTSAYLQKCALAQKVQRENDARQRQQSTSVPESSGKVTATSRTSCDKFAGRSPTYIGQQQVAADSLVAAQLQATIQAPSQVVKREMGPGGTKPTETRETRSSETKTHATGGTGSSETKRGRQPKAATQTRSSVAAVKEENSEETKSSANGVARDSASGSGHVLRYSGKSANKKSSQKHKRGKRIRRSKRPGGDPSLSDSSSSGSLSSSESSSGSDSDWERGLAEELAPATVPAANGQSYTFRPYIQYGAVEMFDPHAKLEDRVNWWDRFVYAAALGVWPEKMKLRQLLGRLPAPLRAWFRQLPEKDQKDWSRLSKLFRKEYCRTKASPYDRYYELGPENGESARSFLYRLNAAAKKADVEYEDSPSDRELHIRRFIKKLADRRLKITLQGQTFKSMKELEKTLKRIEAVQRDDGYETPPPPKTRDAKPSGVRFSRFPPSRRTQGERAYLVENLDSESEDKASPPSDSEEKPEPRYLPGTPPPSMGRTVTSEKINEAQASETIVQVPRPPTTEEVFRAAEQMGWRPPIPQARPPSPYRDNSLL
ncbi:hypothetical protein PHYSODRAFT_335598 [Phytophthora sojae]|uniref:Retrotransposon gag domain-containing protein n=1 Tax=Phytophthora sojae (strain P6497) TaxID=1094619 RepID=G4ZQU1_PHYSP|nr:hypothetical protein PHYSODRAFT_335598 [Phytophthora sojae]EGZ13889.1 hypothetical protein PHYSODRAFT_335598 [Phytophthora sojae]|eukprot:XP_009531318.1 hypothetical protein PHYSODRAFT_335598 [Phytophthora sojae]